MRDHRAESRLRQARDLGADDLVSSQANHKEHYNVSTTTEAVRPLSDEELAAVELPDFERKYIKAQPLYTSAEGVKNKDGERLVGREFNAGGPKATMVAKYIMHGGFTRKEIADFCNCSVSRVGEVLWAMDAGKVEHPEILRRREPAKPESKPEEAASASEVIEPTIVLQDENEDDEDDEDDQDDEA